MSKSSQAKVTIPKTPEDFVLQAIPALRDVTKSQGIDVRLSGLNTALKKLYGVDPKTITKGMSEKGLITVIPCKKGSYSSVRIYLKGECPTGSQRDVDSTVKAVLLKMSK
jgi:hypothetical protein